MKHRLRIPDVFRAHLSEARKNPRVDGFDRDAADDSHVQPKPRDFSNGNLYCSLTIYLAITIANESDYVTTSLGRLVDDPEHIAELSPVQIPPEREFPNPPPGTAVGDHPADRTTPSEQCLQNPALTLWSPIGRIVDEVADFI